jgi:8-amino-7-oxononanoate synthase
MQNAVAIIGMGAQFPGARDLPAFRRAVRSGAVHFGPVPRQRWDHGVVHSPNPRHPNKTPARLGAFMDGIDLFAPEFFGVTPKRAKIMDPQQRLMLEVSRHALEDAGYAKRKLAQGRVGVYVGASSSDHRMLIANAVNLPCDLAGRSGQAPSLSPEAVAAVAAALPPIQAYSIVGQQLNMIAANVSQAFDFIGPAFAIDTACSSALAALHEAVLHLRQGAVDAALVGGVYVQLDPIMMVCFSRIGALSFSDRCRPFQASADGFVLGEGVGAVVLKRFADARRDGDRIVAVIRGIAMNNDGSGTGPLSPSSAGQAAAVAQAWRDAGLDPASVGLLEAHATATPVGDGIELAALKEVFGARVPGPVPISSVKANIGHGLASAGMASLLKASIAVHDGIVPPQPVAGPLRREFAESGTWLRIPVSAEPWAARAGTPRRAGVSAFGFGGTNVHVVLEEAPCPEPAVPESSRGPFRFVFSAPNKELLGAYIRSVGAALRDTPASPRDVAHTLAQRRADRVQASFSAATEAEMLNELAALCAVLDSGMEPISAGPEDCSGRLVLLPPSPLAVRKFWLMDAPKPVRTPPRGAAAREPEPATPEGEGLRMIAAAVCAVTAWRAEDVHMEQRLVGDLGFDSLTTLEFMTVLGRSLPGLTPPPRDLFTPELTVGDLAAYLVRAMPTAARTSLRSALTFERSRHAWLHEHRPGGRPLLPLAALTEAALAAMRADAGASAALAEFKVLVPVDVSADRIALVADVAENLSFALRGAEGGSVLATGAALRASAADPFLQEPAGSVGELPLAAFFAEFGFHGPALRALDGVPLVGPKGASGWLREGRDSVVYMDGALQLALYWLAIHRQETAVATEFKVFRQIAQWPEKGRVRCVAILADEDAEELRGDFDFFDEGGRPIAQWRGLAARIVVGATSRSQAGPAGWPEVRELAERKASLIEAGIAMPYFAVHQGIAGATTRVNGRELVNFSSYNYLGLAGNPVVSRAAAEAVQEYGTSASASRVVSGERPLHAELEREIAGFLGCEAALTLVSGHATNVTLIGHLFGPEDVVIHDSLAHDCIVTGARLSGARRLAFPHNDMAALEELLSRERPKFRRALIAVEGVYSMDGDLAPLAKVVDMKIRHDAILLVDEAHSLGVLGSTGRGSGEHFQLSRDSVDLWMGTLSKALASCGGYVAGSAELLDYLRFTLPGFVYSVGLAPANAAAALAALRLLGSEPGLPRRLQARSDFFRARCRERGVDIGASAHSAVVPCITGSSDQALRLSQALGARGINVQPIFHPAVEEGRARLRFFVTAGHTEGQLSDTAHALGEELAALRTHQAGTRK